MALLVIVSLAAVVYFKTWVGKGAAILVGGTCLVGLATSASRAPLLGLVFGVVGILILLRNPKLLVAAGLIGAITLWQVGSSPGAPLSGAITPRCLPATSSWGARSRPSPMASARRSTTRWARAWPRAWAWAARRAWSGIPREAWTSRKEAEGFVENEYGRSLRELGIPGTVIFAWLLLSALASGFWAYKRLHTNRYRAVAGATVGIMLNLLAQMAVGSALYLVPGGILFWLFYAIARRLPELEAIEYPELGAKPAEAEALTVPVAAGAP